MNAEGARYSCKVWPSGVIMVPGLNVIDLKMTSYKIVALSNISGGLL